MSLQYDGTDFIDDDLRAARHGTATSTVAPSQPGRAPTREEVEFRVSEMQQKLTDLKRSQEALERERVQLEETRRRQIEFQTGREEMVQNLTRGIGLLEEAEFNARRDAEQMLKSLTGLKDSLEKVELLDENSWSSENYSVQLTRGLTTVENARLEWNEARLKWPILSGRNGEEEAKASPEQNSIFERRSFFDLCKMGLALTWPLAVVALIAVGAFVFILLN